MLEKLEETLKLMEKFNIPQADDFRQGIMHLKIQITNKEKALTEAKSSSEQ